MDPGSPLPPELGTPASSSRAASVKRWRILAIAGAVIAVVVTILVRLGGGADEPRSGPPLASAASRPVLAAIVATIAKLEAAVTPSSARGAEQIDVCGIGWVGAKADGSADEAALQAARPALLAARRRLLDAMAAAPDEFSQAAALWLDLYGDPSEQASAGAADMRPIVAARHDALARRALSTADPRVYALAFRSCSRAPEQGACAMLNAARWAQVDEGNATPWMFMLDEARRRNDEAAVADALFHIASARRFDDRFFAAAGAIEAHAGPLDIDTIAAVGVSVEAIGMAAALSAPLQTLTQACRLPEIGNANRRQLCEGVAEVMVERSDTLLLQRIGIGMGRRLGWREERTDALAGEYAAWTDSQALSNGSGGTDSDCSSMKKMLGRFARQASVGEVSVMHEWAATTGRSRESFAQAGRDVRLRREAEQAAAVRDAAAASGNAVASASAPR